MKLGLLGPPISRSKLGASFTGVTSSAPSQVAILKAELELVKASVVSMPVEPSGLPSLLSQALNLIEALPKASKLGINLTLVVEPKRVAEVRERLVKLTKGKPKRAYCHLPLPDVPMTAIPILPALSLSAIIPTILLLPIVTPVFELSGISSVMDGKVTNPSIGQST